jgi:glycine/D-amino acid oxidase-like deaminating enzyme
VHHGEMDELEALAEGNFAGLRSDLARHAIECDYETPGVLTVALEPRELQHLREEIELAGRFGHDVELLDAEATRAQIDSPTYLGAVWHRTGSALVDPGRLADGLRAAAARAGVRIHELSPVRSIHDTDRAALTVSTEGGVVQAPKVLMATSAYPPLIPAVGRYIAPVYDYR